MIYIRFFFDFHQLHINPKCLKSFITLLYERIFDQRAADSKYPTLITTKLQRSFKWRFTNSWYKKIIFWICDKLSCHNWARFYKEKFLMQFLFCVFCHLEVWFNFDLRHCTTPKNNNHALLLIAVNVHSGKMHGVELMAVEMTKTPGGDKELLLKVSFFTLNKTEFACFHFH